MLAANQRIWGFETNFGGLADLAVVKANQLMPKPAHLTWEEAACNALCNSTSYRMLVSPNGADMKQGDTVLVWGASRRPRRLRRAVRAQRRRHPGRRRVVAREGRAAARARRASTSSTARRPATSSGRTSTRRTRASGAASARTSAALVGEDPNIVFEHPGRQTMGASVFVVRPRRHHRHLCGDVRLHDRVRQPPPLDEAQVASSRPTSPTTARRGTPTG